MKHVRESLKDFENEQYFRRLFESEESQEKAEKTGLQDKEKDGLDIIKKITSDFEKFKTSAKGEIIKFKEFWEENQRTKELFTETGNVYKMHDSDYVVGVLDLPAKVLSDGSLDGGMGAIDEPEDEIIEGKPMGEDKELAEGEDIMPEGSGGDMGAGAGGVMEALDEKPRGEEESLEDQVPVDDETAPEEKPADDLGLPPEKPETEEEPRPEEPETMGEEPPKEELPPAEEEPGLGQEAETPESGEAQTYLVVYDVTGDERDEIFRCGSSNAVKAFKAFYEDTFKGTMKAIIQEYKEKKEQEKIEAEKKEKEHAETEKRNKLHKFLGESKSITKKMKCPHCNKTDMQIIKYAADGKIVNAFTCTECGKKYTAAIEK